MTVRLLTWAERPDLVERGPSSEEVWPEYNRHGDVFEHWWTPLLEELPEYRFALYDDAAGHPHLFTGDSLFPGGVGNTFGDSEAFQSLLGDVVSKIAPVTDRTSGRLLSTPRPSRCRAGVSA